MNVSDHAILRWFERVEGMDMTFVRKSASEAGFDPDSDRDLCHYLCGVIGLSKGEIVFKILTPLVKAAIKGGAKRVVTGNVAVLIDKNTVVTIVPAKITAARRLRRMTYEATR